MDQGKALDPGKVMEAIGAYGQGLIDLEDTGHLSIPAWWMMGKSDWMGKFSGAASSRMPWTSWKLGCLECDESSLMLLQELE